jgi:hypothetical protein
VRWRREPEPFNIFPIQSVVPCPWRAGYLSDHIGPLVANSIEDAASQVLACISTNPQRSWILDVPISTGAAWQAWLERTGFTPQRTFTRMYRGPAQPLAPNLYATRGPEFGPLI